MKVQVSIDLSVQERRALEKHLRCDGLLGDDDACRWGEARLRAALASLSYAYSDPREREGRVLRGVFEKK